MNVNETRRNYITSGINDLVGSAPQIAYGGYAVAFYRYVLPDRLTRGAGVDNTSFYQKALEYA